MPKKTKKGKGKKKGKKGKKDEAKPKKPDSVATLAAISAQVWEARLEISERTKKEYRESAKKLMMENDALQSQMMQTEKDAIDVVSYLKQQDHQKDIQVEKLQQQVREIQKESQKEKEKLVETFSSQINTLEEKLALQTRELGLMQSELKQVKEFRRKRGQMQKELDEIKDTVHNTTREHKANLMRMEQRFFEEKMHLQQEANQKIAELAEKAHTEAISNLDETTKSVYKENVRLAEALTYHMKEGDALKKERDRLTQLNETLMEEKETSSIMMQEKIIQVKQQKERIKELQSKVQLLEQSLSRAVKEFETEKEIMTKKAAVENEATKIELEKLQRVIEMKTREMNRVKHLARNIIDQRTEIERFFLDSLDQVRQEISITQAQYRHDAYAAYQEKMSTAHSGKGQYPKIRTFSKLENSTNSVFKDMEVAERLYDVKGKVDISDLTWEQKERVLRYLFAKINGINKVKKATSAPLFPTAYKPSFTLQDNRATEEPHDSTFLTQQQVNVPHLELPQIQLNKHPVIPEITSGPGPVAQDLIS